jgi:hypothetical protein
VADESRVALSHEELALLVGGIDLSMTRQRRWYRKEVGVEEENSKSRRKKAIVLNRS